MSTPPPVPPPRRTKTRPLLLWLFIGSALLAVLALGIIPGFYLVEKYRGRAAWRAYETEAKARGVQLDFAAYIPPEIPDAENFASIPIFDAAFRAVDAKEEVPDPLKLPDAKDGELPKFADMAKQQRLDLAAWQHYFVEAGLLPAAGENAAADVLLALAKFAAPLVQIDAASARPHCRFPVHWENAYAAAVPHLGILNSASKLYALRLSAHLALGDSALACEDFRAGLRLSTATTHEPGIIPSLTRIALTTAMEKAVWDGLSQHQWAEPELRKIEADLARLDWLQDYIFAIGSERAASNLTFDIIIKRAQHMQLLHGFSQKGDTTLNGALRLYPIGWLDQSKVRMNHFYDELSVRIDPAARRLFPERPVPSSTNNITGEPRRFCYMYFIITSAAVESVENFFVHAATFTDLARLACALERCRLARGAFPQALSELMPDFLATLPAEIVNGEPYRYHRADDGSFLLYSVGPDLRDGGGVIDPKATASKQADWVWRYPQ